MKKTKLKKFISLALTAVMICGLFAGFSVRANEYTPEMEIYSATATP